MTYGTISFDTCPQCGSCKTFGFGWRQSDLSDYPNRGCVDCKCEWNGKGISKDGNRVDGELKK
jgi:hypothetical protein